MRYHGHDHMREMMGHFSPGPQYSLPPTIGGAAGNAYAAQKSLQQRVEKFAPHRLTVQLNATQLGAEPCFALTPGSFADPARASRPQSSPRSSVRPPQTYWRTATTMQDEEISKHGRRADEAGMDGSRKPWTEAGRAKSCYGSRVQEHAVRDYYEGRGREASPTPLRQLGDVCADPPLANVFGGLSSKHDFGLVGGIDRQWRESKVVTAHGSTGTVFGPPPRSGPLRSVHVQPMGTNSIPRTVPQAVGHFTGGRITMYHVDRPMTAESLADEISPLAATATSSGSQRDHERDSAGAHHPSRQSFSRERESRSPARALETPVGTRDLHGYADLATSLSPSRHAMSLGPSRMTSRVPSRPNLSQPSASRTSQRASLADGL